VNELNNSGSGNAGIGSSKKEKKKPVPHRFLGEYLTFLMTKFKVWGMGRKLRESSKERNGVLITRS